jgi:hypothetical protein
MSVPDFTPAETQLVSQILLERYSRVVLLQSADVELQLDPGSEQLTTCPDSRFRCQFFYSANEQFGTGREVYDSLGDCVVTLLHVQADHHLTRASSLTETIGNQAPAQDEDYHGPLII